MLSFSVAVSKHADKSEELEYLLFAVANTLEIVCILCVFAFVCEVFYFSFLVVVASVIKGFSVVKVPFGMLNTLHTHINFRSHFVSYVHCAVDRVEFLLFVAIQGIASGSSDRK